MDRLTALSGPELVFGLVGAVGTDLKAVTHALRIELSRVGYAVEEIHVRALLNQLSRYAELNDEIFESEFERAQACTRSETLLRETTDATDIMALLAISAIRLRRIQGRPDLPRATAAVRPLERTAFVIRSLKHPDEIHTLRHIYGRAFNLISSYSPKEDRVTKLASTIADSCSDPHPDRFRSSAETLISIDEQDDAKLGSNVREAFPLGDLFVDTRSHDALNRSLSRFVPQIWEGKSALQSRMTLETLLALGATKFLK